MKKAVILLEKDYQDLEAWYPYYRLKEAGIDVVMAAPDGVREVKGKYGYIADEEIKVAFSQLKAEDYDLVLIPGGWAPDYLRRHQSVLDFIKGMDSRKKVVAAICHAGWVIVSAGIVKGRKATCFRGIRDDLKNAQALYEDSEVVVDGNLITSRTPDDLPAFMKAILAGLG